MSVTRTYGYRRLPEPTYVEGLGTEVSFEVHEIEDGQPGCIVAFTGNEAVAKRIVAQLMNEQVEG